MTDKMDEKLATIDSLIADLSNKNGLARQRARQSLVAIGKPAVGALLKALEHSNFQVRWEAAKAIGEIGDPTAAPALVKALEDEDSGIRWLAGDGLIGMGRDGLGPLLQALTACSDAVWLQEGAHHVLRTLIKRSDSLRNILSPVLAALESPEPSTGVCQAAFKALEVFERDRG